eukprot:TRINITY_DN3878_c0_g1_i1.p1 TRINITY_DN3878_c0_g1~~TRINITY_DN3878_c0_g1_i1.p1  ORF type:complete len:732 (-),score=132.22 TRINITY_DN3878_c0_g1_i1:23-2218(-)
MGSVPIPIEEVGLMPRPGQTSPNSFKFTPDNNLLIFLQSQTDSLVQHAYALDTTTLKLSPLLPSEPKSNTEETLTLDEKLRQERRRNLSLGVQRFRLAPVGYLLLLPLGGSLFVQDKPFEDPRELVSKSYFPIDPHISPDGSKVAFVSDSEIYMVNVKEGEAPIQLTDSARNTGKTNGLAEYIAQEEMDRMEGFWWSPDSSRIAFIEVDETHIPEYVLTHLLSPNNQTEEHRYAFTGKDNAYVRIGIVEVNTKEVRWLDGIDKDIYIPRVDWTPDGNLLVQIQNREQTEIRLVQYQKDTWKPQTILTERSEKWVNIHDLLRPLHSGQFLWGSERNGFRHLYLYSSEGREIGAITSGEWQVDELISVDEGEKIVYFTATKESALEKHLYSVRYSSQQETEQTELPNNQLLKLTQEKGFHSISALNLTKKIFVDIFESVEVPRSVNICSLELSSTQETLPVLALFRNTDPRIKAFDLKPPELIEVPVENGPILYCHIYRPPSQFTAPYKTIVSVYGGPHVQYVQNSYRATSDLSAQNLAREGFLVVRVDNRGSSRRGKAFESAIHLNMGHLELLDQRRAIEYLRTMGLSHPSSPAGIYGWSYGGYMTCLALLSHGDVFGVGVAGAPVTEWEGYDTHYTERYMGTPKSNPEGYRTSSVLNRVESMKDSSKLLLVHGLVDENVHFRHTAKLTQSLSRAMKKYDLICFPSDRHGCRNYESRLYLEYRILDYFKQNL